MKKIALGMILLCVPILSGCSLPKMGGSSVGATAFVRSTDGGVNFESKSKLSDKADFASAEAISLAMSPLDTRHIVVGTKESGLFASDDSGDSWRKLVFPPTKVYGLIADASDPKKLFATGEWQGTGKIYRSSDGGENWDEVYTEPTAGTVVSALAQNPFNSQVLYAGTSKGVLIRTNDGGQTWQNIDVTSSMRNRIVWTIAFDPKKSGTMYFLVDGAGVYVTESDKVVTEPNGTFILNSGGASKGSSGAASLTVDPSRSGTIYVGSTSGLLRSVDFGKTWEALNIIESSKKSGVRAIAINPRNSSELLYVSALTLYKSTDGGAHWSTHPLESDKAAASFVQYDAYNPQTIFVGFKN